MVKNTKHTGNAGTGQRVHTRRCWSAREFDLLRLHYPHVQTKVLAIMLNRNERSVYMQAKALGIKKSIAFLNSGLSGRTNVLTEAGRLYRYPKGHVPANKGRRWEEYLNAPTIEKLKATQFKKGNQPANKKPVGSERITRDGYREIKVAEPNKWQALHRLMWEETFGPIPKGMNVQFVTKDKTNVHPWNLELRTKAQNMKLNSCHSYGPEIAKAIQLIGALTRQINKKTKQHGKH